ncbi:hypothetical protein VTO58DRAFT_102470 [Aureobasidium pullulans]
MRLQSPPQLRTAPVIVDEESAVPESVIIACQEAQKGGLLASSDYGNLLASMSGYEKTPSYGYGYGIATRPDQAPGYPAYNQSSYGLSYSNSHAQVPSGLPDAAQIPLLTEESYQSHDSSFAQQNASSYPSYMAAGSRTLPDIVSITPQRGPAGGRFIIYMNATEDLESNGVSFIVSFGTKRCEGRLTTLPGSGQQPNFAIIVDVPAFESTASSSTAVNIYLEMTDGNKQALSMPIEVGQYTYTDATPYAISSPSQGSTRKRKMSEDAQSPSKRPSSQNLRDSPLHNPTDVKFSPPSSTIVDPYSSRPQTASSAMSYARSFNAPAPTQYSQTMQQAPTYRLAPTPIGMPQPQPFNSYPSTYMTGDRAAPTSQVSNVSSTGANPPLIRTTALQPSPTGMSPSQPFNPYAMYPSNIKAVLKLEGDLNGMASDWNADEVSARRRIVRFRRSQNGSVISASFQPVTPEEHAQAPGCIYVNCIWWEEENGCYITSVDTIQLLESLVAVRFTVEEKNRIRRNLEGFRPQTVSKTKTKCEEFFKIIMGFPSPKPRNIEKDVKVFPWRILAGALKKIIGKYSASYSSTAGALPSPSSVAPPRHQLHSSSPPSVTSNTSMTFPTSMTATSMPMHQSNVSAGMGAMSAGLGDSRLMMQQQQPHAQQQQHHQHQYQQQHQYQHQGQQPPSHQAHAHQAPQPGISWHQPSNNYTTEPIMPNRTGSIDFATLWETTNPQAPQGHQQQRIPSISQSLPHLWPQQDWKDFRTTQA